MGGNLTPSVVFAEGVAVFPEFSNYGFSLYNKGNIAWEHEVFIEHTLYTIRAETDTEMYVDEYCYFALQ